MEHWRKRRSIGIHKKQKRENSQRKLGSELLKRSSKNWGKPGKKQKRWRTTETNGIDDEHFFVGADGQIP